MGSGSDRDAPSVGGRFRAATIALLVMSCLCGFFWIVVAPFRTVRDEGVQRAKQRIEEQRERRRSEIAHARKSATAECVVFFGSSTVEFWPLESSFRGRRCLNFGLGGDTAPELLARLDASLPEQRPAGLVLYSGSADLRRAREPVDRIATDLEALLKALRARWPDVPVLVLGVLPGIGEDAASKARLRRVNEILQGLAAAHAVEFLLPPTSLCSEGGAALRPEFARDQWHLNAAGYQLLSEHVLSSETSMARILSGIH